MREKGRLFTVFEVREAARRRRLDMLTGKRCSAVERMKRSGKDEGPWRGGKKGEQAVGKVGKVCERTSGSEED